MKGRSGISKSSFVVNGHRIGTWTNYCLNVSKANWRGKLKDVNAFAEFHESDGKRGCSKMNTRPRCLACKAAGVPFRQRGVCMKICYTCTEDTGVLKDVCGLCDVDIDSSKNCIANHTKKTPKWLRDTRRNWLTSAFNDYQVKCGCESGVPCTCGAREYVAERVWPHLEELDQGI